MTFIRLLLLAGLAGALAACAAPTTETAERPKYSTSDVALTGPVDHVLVEKAKRTLSLFSGGEAVRKYHIDLGFAPAGDKTRHGDGRTPEGTYRITHRNPWSSYYLSIGTSYPDRRDREEAARLGVSPGGDIFIHGRDPENPDAGPDWTAGCIAVLDRDMDEIYEMVDPGTPITIRP